MHRIYSVFFLAIFIFSLTVKIASADSAYVLPYPSAMPGSIIYRLDLIKEAIAKYWYFGDFGQFNYNLKEADKYLVESKTLFEYGQHLLAYKALLKSDNYFKKVWPNLKAAERHGKNIFEKKTILINASIKHIEILSKLKGEVPEFFVWSPEKAKPTDLKLWEAISKSIKIREESL